MMRRARIKKAISALLGVLLTGMLSGCWDYRGLDEISLVAGFTIDIDDETGLLQLNFDIVDLSVPIEQVGTKTFILQSEGETIFDAIRNAKMKNNSKLYFGDTKIVIVSRAVVDKYGVFPVVEWFLRDNETRENAYIAVAQTEKAKDIFQYKLRENSVASLDLAEIIKEDSKVTSSTVSSEIYEVYNTLKEEGVSLTLPALANLKKNDQTSLPAANGVVIFRNDKIIGELTPQETKYFLFATNRTKGGLFPFSSTGNGEKDVTLEIAENKTKRSFEYADGVITVMIETDSKVYVGEVMREANLLEKGVHESLKTMAEETLKEEITKLIKKVQSEYKSDIFGFGKLIHKKDKELWKEISEDWEQMFPEIEIEVSCKITFLDSAHVKNTIEE